MKTKCPKFHVYYYDDEGQNPWPWVFPQMAVFHYTGKDWFNGGCNCFGMN